MKEIIDKEHNLVQQNPVLSIIIVNYNVKEYILNCIQSIQDKINSKRCPYEVIVSDNGSVDGSVEAIRERFPWVKIIENKANLGFGKANNIGSNVAKGEILFFLNPDTKIIYGIEEIVDYFMKYPKLGLMGPSLINEKDQNATLFYLFIYYNLIIQIIDLIFDPPFKRLYEQYKKWLILKSIKKKKPLGIKLVQGSAMLFSKKTFVKIGRFDEHIFMHQEEPDICIRVNKNNYKVMIYPSAAVLHYGGKSKKDIIKDITIMWVAIKVVLKKHFKLTWVIRYSLGIINELKQGIKFSIKTYIYHTLKMDYIVWKLQAQKHFMNFRISCRVLFTRLNA